MPGLVLKYRTGEEIKKGDRVLFHRNPAEIELVACDDTDAETDWYMKEFGGGVLIREPKVFGRAFIPADQLDEDEDLEFVSRRVSHRGSAQCAVKVERGALPGKPGRQTAGASSRTPHRARLCGADGAITPSMCAGHDLSCPYEEIPTAESPDR